MGRNKDPIYWPSPRPVCEEPIPTLDVGENSLSGIRFLAQQAAAQARAVSNARRAADLAGDRYRSAIVSYLEVVDANREALQAERASAHQLR